MENNQSSGLLSAAQASLPARFNALATQWRAETSYLSSVQNIVTDRAYQQIIGIGPPALPLLLRELRDRPAFWFWALTAIAGEDPANGNPSFTGARTAWLDWGLKRGLIDSVDALEDKDAQAAGEVERG